MMKAAIYLFFLSGTCCAQAQDTTTVIEFDNVDITRNVFVKRLSLYDESEVDTRFTIRGFDQLDLYAGEMSDEIWFTENKTCIELSQKSDAQETYLSLRWNKDTEGCDWVGFGFGWDFWAGKDMANIVDTAAIELMVRTTGKNMSNLPWALGFEDYSNGQSWIGFSKDFIKAEKISAEWTQILIPLALFPFDPDKCDPHNIKQLIFQVFAEDELELKSVKIVPFQGKLKKEIVSAPTMGASLTTDGNANDWASHAFESFGNGQEFSLAHSNQTLHIAVKLNDPTPRQNKQSDKNLWNGDAIELAFSTNPNADPKRTSFLLSDYHIGLNLGANPYMWNWSLDQAYSEAKFAISEDGNFVEIELPLSSLTGSELLLGTDLSFEIAVDQSDSGDARAKQQRWSSSSEGFHVNPSLWGKVKF